MWKKLICALVLAAFLGLQTVNGLYCYTCDSPSSCRSPTSQYCNVQTANTTSGWLRRIHSNVPSIVENSFKCLNLTYYYSQNNVKTQEILGCYYSSIPVCYLSLNVTNSYDWAKYCNTCNYDNCNRNPAGTLSKSSFTIVSSALLLILAKIFV
ncbi:uncharacterized protein LOC6576588 [Drosophila mojavensis]|uniref:Protein sleepless n=1 Tax=Drosophila mojavensis TaxID=7230 RepID=B4KFB9_DROMO|nr:uncharacterized protein LOC6576588 [Drosophila mojavensis]EDW12019.1 uncharacterized protein Dmoj_GI17456 [Drosophila mojavensis]